jgi:hypothetical protein
MCVWFGVCSRAHMCVYGSAWARAPGESQRAFLVDAKGSARWDSRPATAPAAPRFIPTLGAAPGHAHTHTHTHGFSTAWVRRVAGAPLGTLAGGFRDQVIDGGRTRGRGERAPPVPSLFPTVR